MQNLLNQPDSVVFYLHEAGNQLSLPIALSTTLLSLRIYELYSDFVMKNPFYETEQVIKCELFEEHLEALIRRYPQAY